MKTNMKEISIKEMDKVNGGTAIPAPDMEPVDPVDRKPIPPIEFDPIRVARL